MPSTLDMQTPSIQRFNPVNSSSSGHSALASQVSVFDVAQCCLNTIATAIPGVMCVRPSPLVSLKSSMLCGVVYLSAVRKKGIVN